MAYDKELDARGQLVVAEALQSVKTAKVVQVRNGRMSQTDGPFAETKEQLGGFILIDVPGPQRRDPGRRTHPAARSTAASRCGPIAKVEKDRVMRYLCMIFATDAQMSVLPPDEMRGLRQRAPRLRRPAARQRASRRLRRPGGRRARPPSCACATASCR